MSGGGGVLRRRPTGTIRYWDGNQAGDLLSPSAQTRSDGNPPDPKAMGGNTNTLGLSAVAMAPLWFEPITELRQHGDVSDELQLGDTWLLLITTELFQIRPPPPPEEVGGGHMDRLWTLGGGLHPRGAASAAGKRCLAHWYPGGLHHVIIRARCLWLQRLRSLLWSFVGGGASIGRQRCWGGLGIGGEPAKGHRSV